MKLKCVGGPYHGDYWEVDRSREGERHRLPSKLTLTIANFDPKTFTPYLIENLSEELYEVCTFGYYKNRWTFLRYRSLYPQTEVFFQHLFADLFE